MNPIRILHLPKIFTLLALLTAPLWASPASENSAGWESVSPRDEIRPRFAYDAKGGPSRNGVLVIESDEREGLAGYWKKSFPVNGGSYYTFSAFRKVKHVESPRRSAVARVLWLDEKGKPVLTQERVVNDVLEGFAPIAEPEYPSEKQTDAKGWTEISGTYRAPAKAAKAVVELHLQWAAKGRVEWRDITLADTSAPTPRKVRLAAVHYRPSAGKTMMENCRQFGPLIEEASARKADLVVLPETLTYFGLGKSYAECAEAIPGPSTEYFGSLAKKHDLYIVAGLLERDRHLVYNVAVLLGPEGKVLGKYRKTCLPRSEISGGITPGKDYPVFQTRFGKLGMMVCYDGFFPEVARQLSMRGAEVIAWP
ncbi:MAG TPA: carbon-nitrogen hydrolase family protein, partial [Candidatus Saccharimonadales bacterium]|nr:carbon-nitrogen hydrolase family protein [Candidatus Saccharimonadales bacterium]